MKKKSLSLEIPSLTMEGNISMYTALMDNTFHMTLQDNTTFGGGGGVKNFNFFNQSFPLFFFFYNFLIYFFIYFL